jgi:outer membrane protein TolC
MARTKTMASLDAKIAKAQTTVEKAKDRYDAAIAELETLYNEKKELQVKQLALAIEKSGKSYEDVLTFIKDGER